MKYKIEYKGKYYYRNGNNCQEAFEKFANHSVFGQRNLIENYKLNQYDADTRGESWAQYFCGWHLETSVMVEKVA